MIKIAKGEENLSEANMDKVIKLLEAEKPITKKAACEMLCISYNTTRLGTLIEKHKNMISYRDTQRKAKRGTPATKDEVQFIVSEYMTGEPISSISASLFRGPMFVNSVLELNNVPVRASTDDYFKPEMIPDAAVRKSFEIGEKVFSSRYNSIARIEHFYQVSRDGENVYRCLLLDEKWMQSCYQPASELASLTHLTELGIKL